MRRRAVRRGLRRGRENLWVRAILPGWWSGGTLSYSMRNSEINDKWLLNSAIKSRRPLRKKSTTPEKKPDDPLAVS